MKNMEKNEGFIRKVEELFPDKANAKIIVACSDGRNRAIQALEALDAAGYVNIVGLRGGFNMWNRTWDAMRRRNLPGDFQEEWQHGADGCGVHATGATFQNQDAFQYADWKDDASGSPCKRVPSGTPEKARKRRALRVAATRDREG